MYRFRVPEIFLGCLLTVAVFAMGMTLESSRQPATNQNVAENPDHGSAVVAADKSPNVTDWLLVLFNGLLFGSTVFLWKANNRSAKIAELALTDLERAFVFIDGFTPQITTAVDLGTDPNDLPERYRGRLHLYMHRFAVLPRWKNGGNTPTRNMKIQVAWRGPTGPIPPEYVYRGDPEPFFLGPLAIEHSLPVEMPPAARLVDYGLHMEGHQPMCWIWGRADYDDIFGKPHFLEWCYQPSFDAHDGKRLRVTFIQWGDYNRTDDG
jgi:hypothetical protein